MVDAVLFDRVLQRANNRLLSDDVAESLRPVFASESLIRHRGRVYVQRPARKSPGRTVSRRGCTLSLLPSGPDEVRCACCTGPGLIPAGLMVFEHSGSR